jgi:hypothetical protein
MHTPPFSSRSSRDVAFRGDEIPEVEYFTRKEFFQGSGAMATFSRQTLGGVNDIPYRRAATALGVVVLRPAMRGLIL